MGKYEYSCFNQLDIFGIAPLFTIRGRSTFQTHIGSFLTICCILVILVRVLFFLYEMIKHKSPNLQSTIYYDDMPSEINLNNNNFSFVFGLQTKEYINYIDESIYKVNAYQIKLTLKNDSSYDFIYQPLKLIKCNDYKFEIIPDNFKKLPLNNLYCLDDKITLKGDYMKEYWNYIKLNFSKCVNSSENGNICKSEEKINELLNGGNIGIFLSDYSFDSNKFHKPYNTHIKNLHKTFSLKYFDNIILDFKIVEIITDSGYFFENNNYFTFTAYDNIQSDIDSIDSEVFISLSISVSTKREMYKRSYIKLQTIFSNVGGMLKMILLVGEYSVYFMRILLYKNYILEFFNLDESEIRLKEVRKIFNLPGNDKIKHNIEKIFYNLSNLDNGSSNYINNYSYTEQNNNRFQLIEDKSECKNNFYDENSIINKEMINKNNNLFSSEKNNILKQNNFLNIDCFNFNERNLISTRNKKRNNIKQINPKIITNENIKTQSDIININVINKKYSQKLQKNILTPKPRLRVIKVPGFFSDFVCKKNTIKTIKQVHENYKEIQFLLDIVHYLKSQNELNIIEKYLFSEDQRKILSYTYTFNADFGLDRKGYEYMIKHEKNKLEKMNVRRNNLNKIIY